LMMVTRWSGFMRSFLINELCAMVAPFVSRRQRWERWPSG
jgi:hypothetical protein